MAKSRPKYLLSLVSGYTDVWSGDQAVQMSADV